MSEKGYFVSTGSYSDYSVAAVFSTREKAEAFVAAHIALGTEYLDANGKWARSEYSRDGDYAVEEADLDPVFGAKGCYLARVTIEGTHPATTPSFAGSRPRPVASYWDEDANAAASATAKRNPWYGCTDIEGFGATRDDAYLAADAMRARVLAGEVVAPFPEWFKGGA